MAAKPFFIQETPVLTSEASKRLVKAVASTRLSTERQVQLRKFAEQACLAYKRSSQTSRLVGTK